MASWQWARRWQQTCPASCKPRKTGNLQNYKIIKKWWTTLYRIYSAGQKFRTLYVMTFLWPPCGRGTNLSPPGRNQPWGPTWLCILFFCLKVGYFDFVKNILKCAKFWPRLYKKCGSSLNRLNHLQNSDTCKTWFNNSKHWKPHQS